MELFVNKSANKENNNPVLVPSQFEILSKEGVFAKTHASLYNHHRFYYRKPRQSLVPQGIGHSSSSQSIHKDIEKIAKQLQSQQLQTMNQFVQPLKEKHPTQYSQPSNTQVTEVMEMLEKENLLRIHQLKPCTPRRAYTPQINYNLPPILYDSKSNNQENNEKETPQIRSKQLFRKIINPSMDRIKKVPNNCENRQKRTNSQFLNTTPTPQKSLKERLNKVLDDQHKIVGMCKRIPEIRDTIDEKQLVELFQSDHFKIELQYLINNTKGSNSQIEQTLQNFFVEQIKKMKEIQEAENYLQEKKQNFCNMLHSYINELKQKL